MPETSTTGTTTLPVGTINVSSTTGFLGKGSFTFNSNQKISYTGTTGSSFTGCTGGGVYPANTPVSLIVSTTSASTGTLPITPINVVSTGGFPPAGNFNIVTSLGIQTIVYSSITNTSFVGCVGGTGAITNTSVITPFENFLTTLSTSFTSLPTGTINVVSTAGFPSAGSFNITSSVGVQTVSYTSTTSTSFVGCTGGTGSITNTSGIVYSAQTITTTTTSSPSTTLVVASTAGFPNTGTLYFNNNIVVTYTGITGTSFTGCSGLYSFPIGTDVLYDTASDLSSTMQDDAFRPVQPLGGSTYDNALITFYKMRGFYVAGSVYETYVVAGYPSTIPPSGHSLINVAVVAVWIDDKILVQDLQEFGQ